MPCTTLLVGKKASYDGSTIIARTEDSSSKEFTPKKFVVVQPQDQPRHYRCTISHLEIDLPETPLRYTSTPNALPKEGVWGEAGVNEKNVAMSATETLTSNPRVLGADPLVELQPAKGTPGEAGYTAEVPGGIGEEDLLTLVLPYIHSAREGVQRLGALLEHYGTYEMNGIAFSDVHEIWWLETVGGHHWIARRVPDDCYAVIPNQLGLDAFDTEDALGEQHDYMCSADLRSFIEENHLDLTAAGKAFNPREAFGSHDDSDHVYNTPRAWAIELLFNPHPESWDSVALDNPEADDIPWCRVPEHKITMEDVKQALSLHYQGTPFDPYERKGDFGDAGSRGAYRPIGINRNSELSAIQLRPYVEDACQAVQWIAFGSTIFNALAPFYTNVSDTPTYLRDTSEEVSTQSLYWTSRIIAALADAHMNACEAALERYQEEVPARGHALLRKTDALVAEQNEGSEQAMATLEAANERMASELRTCTQNVLAEVLDAASYRMRCAYSRSDG